MHIDTVYKGTQNGCNGIWRGNHPEDIIVSEELNLLVPESGMLLEHKETKEQVSCVILKTKKEQDNWTEVEAPEEEDTCPEKGE